MGELAQIIGDRHNTPVTFVLLCEISLALWRRLKTAECLYDAGGHDGHFDDLLFIGGVTADEAMLSAEMGLNDEMRRLYQSGELTFGILARHQPSVFLT